MNREGPMNRESRSIKNIEDIHSLSVGQSRRSSCLLSLPHVNRGLEAHANKISAGAMDCRWT